MNAYVLLEKEQQELLVVLVEASRNVAYENRQKFMAIYRMDSRLAHLHHPGLPKDFPGAYLGDIEILARERLVNLTHSKKGTPRFDVTPQGFQHYELIKSQQGEPIERLEGEVRHYLEQHSFQKKYPNAYDKWMDAENDLWKSDSKEQLTTIGHKCRETIQLFAAALVEEFKPPDLDTDVTHTVSRIRSVLQHQSGNFGKATNSFLDALVAYWGTLSDLIQRQEHGALKEGEALKWEDARRVVFHTALVMYEVDRTIRLP